MKPTRQPICKLDSPAALAAGELGTVRGRRGTEAPNFDVPDLRSLLDRMGMGVS